jgi:HSP20 family protein
MTETNSVTQKSRVEATGPESTFGGTQFVPRVDIFETDKELVLLADLPGVSPEDVDLRYEAGELILHGPSQTPRAPRSTPAGRV